jgi:hypothetical protein
VNGKTYVGFPSETRGFYYYHVPDNAPVFAGGVRFRLCPSEDPKSFKNGSDLLKTDGFPWELSNWAFAFPGEFQTWGEELVRDGVVHPEAIEICKKLASRARISTYPHQSIVYSLRQTFPMLIGRDTTRTWIVNEEGMIPLVFHNDLIQPFTKNNADEGVKCVSTVFSFFTLKDKVDESVCSRSSSACLF